MADLTVYAESLIATVARAFYEDEAVCLIDVLIRDKFLRDDDMAKRLQLPAKRLRATLQFLTDEHLVSFEMVDDLAQGGSQATKFYYIDYNRAVHSIRLRVHLLRKKLEEQERRARGNSFYLCPGYDKKRCNGRYTEQEVQNVVGGDNMLFLCQECSKYFENSPNPPPLEEYTLKLVDNERDLSIAEDNLRRLNVQLSGKSIGNQQLRAGIYDLLQKCRGGRGKDPISSNLPSENFALGIGSKRIEGTGRTMAMKVKKMAEQGLANSAAEAREYLVGGGRRSSNGLSDENLMFLKSAHGHEIQLTVERGAGSRAQVLARQKLRLRKLMDAAASRVGASLPIPVRVAESIKRKAEAAAAAAAAAAASNKKVKTAMSSVPDFLSDNIGRADHERTVAEGVDDWDEENGGDENNDTGERNEPDLLWGDDMEKWVSMPEDERTATFQREYKIEMARQEKMLNLNSGAASPSRPQDQDDDIPWEDGDLN
uniref:HTH TFE/IIEalpha-type domain-containing protein n=2 Tax=Amphora coffeiformis TaxID=265554 RepID=A0A7S3L6B3_9STRA